VLWLDEDAPVEPRLGAFRLVGTFPYALPEPAARRRVLGCWKRA